MDISVLKKFRNNVKSVANQLNDLDRRVHNNELLNVCESVHQSENGKLIQIFAVLGVLWVLCVFVTLVIYCFSYLTLIMYTQRIS